MQAQVVTVLIFILASAQSFKIRLDDGELLNTTFDGLFSNEYVITTDSPIVSFMSFQLDIDLTNVSPGSVSQAVSFMLIDEETQKLIVPLFPELQTASTFRVDPHTLKQSSRILIVGDHDGDDKEHQAPTSIRASFIDNSKCGECGMHGACDTEGNCNCAIGFSEATDCETVDGIMFDEGITELTIHTKSELGFFVPPETKVTLITISCENVTKAKIGVDIGKGEFGPQGTRFSDFFTGTKSITTTFSPSGHDNLFEDSTLYFSIYPKWRAEGFDGSVDIKIVIETIKPVPISINDNPTTLHFDETMKYPLYYEITVPRGVVDGKAVSPSILFENEEEDDCIYGTAAPFWEDFDQGKRLWNVGEDEAICMRHSPSTLAFLVSRSFFCANVTFSDTIKITTRKDPQFFSDHVVGDIWRECWKDFHFVIPKGTMAVEVELEGHELILTVDNKPFPSLESPLNNTILENKTKVVRIEHPDSTDWYVGVQSVYSDSLRYGTLKPFMLRVNTIESKGLPFEKTVIGILLIVILSLSGAIFLLVTSLYAWKHRHSKLLLEYTKLNHSLQGKVL